jgi:hypothetical protein
MMIHISRDGEQFGPYTLEDANAFLAQGSLLATDQAWYEGAPDWMPLTGVPGIQWGNPVIETASVAAGSKVKPLMVVGIAAGVLTVFGVVGWGYPGVFKKEGSSEQGKPEIIAENSKGESPESSASTLPSFVKTAEPIFKKYGCYDCHHSKESNKAEADLDFSDRSTWAAFLSPNQKGNPATTPLVLALTATDANGKPMPPKGDRVSDAEVEMIKNWIVEEWGE